MFQLGCCESPKQPCKLLGSGHLKLQTKAIASSLSLPLCPFIKMKHHLWHFPTDSLPSLSWRIPNRRHKDTSFPWCKYLRMEFKVFTWEYHSWQSPTGTIQALSYTRCISHQSEAGAAKRCCGLPILLGSLGICSWSLSRWARSIFKNYNMENLPVAT